VIAELRQIQVDWALTPTELSSVTHTPIETLRRYLALKAAEAEELPTVPAGLENAVPLISVFKSLQKLRPKAEDQHDWLRSPNSILENQIPLQVMMMSPNHLAWVGYTLESAVRQENL
jgi:hypothetical protein